MQLGKEQATGFVEDVPAEAVASARPPVEEPAAAAGADGVPTVEHASVS